MQNIPGASSHIFAQGAYVMGRNGGMLMTFSELRKKDVICIADGRLLGRVSDLVIDADRGQILALIVPGCSGT